MLSAKNVRFPSTVQVSAECKELIKRMLEYDQDKRIDVKEIYNNNFLLQVMISFLFSEYLMKKKANH